MEKIKDNPRLSQNLLVLIKKIACIQIKIVSKYTYSCIRNNTYTEENVYVFKVPITLLLYVILRNIHLRLYLIVNQQCNNRTLSNNARFRMFNVMFKAFILFVRTRILLLLASDECMLSRISY